MNIKTKLRLGFGFLFLVIMVIGLISTYYLNKLTNDSNAILKDNYDTLVYSKAMLESLDTESGPMDKTQMTRFEQNLKFQENNETEPGEKDLTNVLRREFNKLASVPYEKVTYEKQKLLVRKLIYKISELNMQGIIRKNHIAQNTANKANLYVAVILTVCFLIAFSFIVNFPSYIANPIRQLTEAIKAIANKNYDQRIEFQSGDEFGELATAFNVMARKLDDYEHSNLAKLLFEKKRIETIIDNMGDPIIGLDENKKILFANPVAIDVLGIKPEKLIGQYAPDVALHNDLFRTLLTNKAEAKGELKIFADNKESYFTKDIFDVRSDNDLVGQVIVLKNVTSFHELDEAKTNFIATISHELKTPISSIKMSLKLLEDQRVGGINEEQAQLVGNIKDDTNRLLSITTELLDLAQVETGNIQLTFDKTKPKVVIDYAVEAIRVQAEQKNLMLNITCPETLPSVYADTEKTAWVLVNLLSNAVRYSGEKSTIDILVEEKDDVLRFSVRDHGKGIEDKYLDKLFDRYFQVPTDGKTRSGTGLGLAISKDFIAAQHGHIWVESELGAGSNFVFELPIAV